jgi:hypothetical protein
MGHHFSRTRSIPEVIRVWRANPYVDGEEHARNLGIMMTRLVNLQIARCRHRYLQRKKRWKHVILVLVKLLTVFS